LKKLVFSVVTQVFKSLTRLICRVDDGQLAKVPMRGPLILAANHVNFLEVPLIYTHLQPRPVTAFAKSENWEKPFTRWLFSLFEAISIRRGEIDQQAFRQARQALLEGKIIAVAPEGTRTNSGQLIRGKPGIVLLALRTGAPILPLVYYGGERFRQNIARLRRTDFHVVVGNPFRLQQVGDRPGRDQRQQMTDEIMYQMAALLPAAYRGYYRDLSQASEQYLVFEAGVESNLRRAVETHERGEMPPLQKRLEASKIA